MKKKLKVVPGAIVAIKIQQDCYSFARVLQHGDLAFYDYRNTVAAIELDHVIKSPVIFKAIVNNDGVEYGRWPVLGHMPLESELLVSKYYIPEIGREDVCKVFYNGAITFDVPLIKCKGLEAGVVWDPEDIEERIRDYYSGRKNEFYDLYPKL